MSAEETARSLGLPRPPRPVGAYAPVVRSGNLLHLSGALPFDGEGGLTHAGKVGREFSVEEGAAAARQCGLNLLAVAREHLGNLDRVGRVVSLTGYVNAPEDFEEAAAVLNGASELMGEVFGERGVHARAAVAVAGLPKGAAVEVSAVLELG